MVGPTTEKCVWYCFQFLFPSLNSLILVSKTQFLWHFRNWTHIHGTHCQCKVTPSAPFSSSFFFFLFFFFTDSLQWPFFSSFSFFSSSHKHQIYFIKKKKKHMVPISQTHKIKPINTWIRSYTLTHKHKPTNKNSLSAKLNQQIVKLQSKTKI